MQKQLNANAQPGSKLPWETPVLRRVGDVGDVLQFPGNGKGSNATDDMGDAPYKPSGQEMK
jgi:hypothetical protein